MERKQLKTLTERWIALALLRWVKVKNAAQRAFFAHRFAAYLFGALALALASSGVAYVSQPWSQSYFSDSNSYEALRALLSGLGSALVGATAIVFTLILFAMQVNVGRMPNALFVRFSQDGRLLIAFVGTLVLSIGVASLSLARSAAASAWIVLGATWATALAVVIFLASYRRAIALINPAAQVGMVAKDAIEDLGRWKNLADRATPLLGDKTGDGEYDSRRYAFFAANPGWEHKANSLASQIVSYGTRLGEQGDHESFRQMLQGMVRIHAAYVTTKGSAFVNSHPLFEIPESRDSFLLSTLEQLRITSQAASARKDEQLSMNCFRAFTDLFRVYASIEYESRGELKHHANLISGYLQSQVQSTIQHRMPDVMMDGVRQLGTVAKICIAAHMTLEAEGPISKIGLLSYVGAFDQAHLPVTQTAMEQLSDLTIATLSFGDTGNARIFEVIRSAAFGGASNLVGATKEASSISGTHKGYLAPYFSTSDSAALLPKLGEVVNAVLTNGVGDNGPRLIEALTCWSDDLHRDLKDLVLLAFRARSSSTFDALNSICVIVEMLLALAQYEHCDERARENLHANARAIAAVMSWVPTDRDSAHSAEACSFKEMLFEMAAKSRDRGSEEIYQAAKSYLLHWVISAGSNVQGWGTLEGGLKLLLGLVLTFEADAVPQLLQQIRGELQRAGDVPRDLRERAADGLRQASHRYGGGRFALRASEELLQRVDRNVLSPALNSVADELIRE